MSKFQNTVLALVFASFNLPVGAQQSIPRTVVPPVADPSGAPSGQSSAYTAFQKCRIDNKAAYDLFSVTQDLISMRDRPQSVEITFQMNPNLRKQYPGGVEQMLNLSFDHYRKLGGTARTVGEVTAGANPCPPPTPYLAHQRKQVVPIHDSSAIPVR